jgi:uncharacterized membrane protein YecN with MAPEG domain
MTNIPITLGTAGILGFFYVVISLRVTAARWKTRVSVGEDTGQPASFGTETAVSPLRIAIRSHANFAEYVPIALILLGGIESAGANRTLCLILAAMLILGRLAHPIGMARKAPNPFRAGGALLTWTMIGVTAIVALLLAF